MFKHTLVGMIAVFAAFGVSARTVYDAGKALHANITSGAPVGDNGAISGTFASADANGGAFNGFTLVGEFPNYVAPGMMLFVR